MSCVVELVYKGNIQNIGNDSIKLISYEGLSEYELDIVNLLFINIGEVVTFKNITDMFLKEEKESNIFIDKFKKIKEKITKSLFDNQIYSKIGNYILKLIKYMSVVIYANIAFLIYFIITENIITITNIIIYNCIVVCILLIVSFLKSRKVIPSITNYKVKFARLWISIGVAIEIVIILLVVFMVKGVISNFNTLIILAILAIINTFVIIKSNTYIFTPYGKEEYRKALALRSYIKDFSLMQDRNIEDVIIWDEYLSYAVAFSIPNRITSKMNEELMKANSVIEKINCILNF